MTVDVTSVDQSSAIAREFAISASRPYRTPEPKSDGDRPCNSCRPASPPGRPSRLPRIAPGSAELLGLPRFLSRRAARLSSSNFASATSRSASSKSSQRLTMIALDHQNVDLSPLGVEAFCRSPVYHVGENRSDVVQPVHCLDVERGLWREVERGTK